MKTFSARSVINWLIGMFICSLGVSFAVKSNFGISMIEAPVYVLTLKLQDYIPWFTMGVCEFMLQGLLLIALWCAVKQFRPLYLLSFAVAVVYGMILDRWNSLINFLIPDPNMAMRIVCAALSTLLCSFGVSCFFRTKLPQQVWESFVKELSDEYHFSITRVKFIFDVSLLSAGLILSLVLFRTIRTEAIGVGTIVTAFVNAPIIGFFGKMQDKLFPLPKE